MVKQLKNRDYITFSEHYRTIRKSNAARINFITDSSTYWNF